MCEPNPAKRRFLFSLIWTALLSLGTCVTCSIVTGSSEEKVQIAKEIKLNTADFELKREGATDYLEFNFEPGTIELPKSTNVEFDFKGSLNQEWMSLNVFMINEQNGEGFIYDTELSHYWGGSGDDSWSEGGNSADFTTIKMPAGTYYVFVAGATNIGVKNFQTYLRQFGERPAAANAPATAPVTPPGKGKLAPQQGVDLKPAAAPAEKRGKLLPEDFPGKASAPSFRLSMKAKRDSAQIGGGVGFIFLLIGFNIWYYIRYRMKEGER